ncbi:hypothetical protein SAMN05421806_11252 [Streptomyces indicus]|uniref:Uncharacterized protein n=1 Tax=Streptomyces indicus TaxID=417292 RepID=A0A1G9ETA3_9ACTN|nr:hypothetical protein SAMN05421806_11252 [Streptomyces indicus]
MTGLRFTLLALIALGVAIGCYEDTDTAPAPPPPTVQHC